MVNNKYTKNKKENGFTIIEMLVVTLILVLITVALAAIIKGLINSSTRIKRLQTVRAQTQEAIHYLTKELRMSEFQDVNNINNSNDDEIKFSWRKANESGNYYAILQVTLDETSINSFFPEDWAYIEDESLQFLASGNKDNEGGNESNPNNRVIIKFNIEVLTNITNDEDAEIITIPIQVMVSLRSYNLTEPE
ncbi:MAG: type II secretion system protein [Patescibacteria group bacterium]|nr:type II secretion system protein [Patescibacteria group bacterium]